MSFIIETFRQVYSTAHGEERLWMPYKVEGQVLKWRTRQEAEAMRGFLSMPSRVVEEQAE